MLEKLLNTFHDGRIEAVNGEIPGDLLVVISIEYIRERFEPPGDTFEVTIVDCQRFEYCKYDSDELISDLEAIANMRLGVLNAEADGGVCILYTECGKVFIEADRAVVRMGGGVPISLKQLVDAANGSVNEALNSKNLEAEDE